MTYDELTWRNVTALHLLTFARMHGRQTSQVDDRDELMWLQWRAKTEFHSNPQARHKMNEFWRRYFVARLSGETE